MLIKRKEINMNLIENVVEIYWDNTTEGESLSTPNNEYKILDDQT